MSIIHKALQKSQHEQINIPAKPTKKYKLKFHWIDICLVSVISILTMTAIIIYYPILTNPYPQNIASNQKHTSTVSQIQKADVDQNNSSDMNNSNIPNSYNQVFI